MVVHRADAYVPTVGVSDDDRFLLVIEEACGLRHIDHLLRAHGIGIGFACLRITHARQIVGDDVVMLRQKRRDESETTGVRQKTVH